MEFDTSRRGFLEAAGAGTAASLAGCSSLQQSPETTEGTDGERSTVTIALTADRQALQQRQQEIKSELQAGNITRKEAQQQFRAAQNELRSKAAAAFMSRADSESNLTVENSLEQLGVLLVSGSAAALVDTLSFDEVNALLSEGTFERAKTQAAQRTETTTTSN